MSQRILKSLMVLGLMAAAMLYGIVSHRHHLPPYSSLQTIYQIFVPPPAPPTASAPDKAAMQALRDFYQLTDVDALIRPRSSAQVQALRQRLVRFLWGRDTLPAHQPTVVVSGIDDPRYSDMPSLRQIDRLTVDMDFGLQSHAYHFHPRDPIGRFVLYHQGHDGDFIKGKPQIAALLDRGYDVLAFSMPLMGMNSQPKVALPRFGVFQLRMHQQLAFLEPDAGHPIRYFLEPVIVIINHLKALAPEADIAMFGISGGGWTTTLAAAVDPRIRQSFPVAGSYPLFLRTAPGQDWGDYEQNEPSLYRVANYLELYVLGAHGTGRQQRQLLNGKDPCCFSGDGWSTYADIVSQHVRTLGPGRFEVSAEPDHDQHTISATAMQLILDDLQAGAVDVSQPTALR